MRAPIRTTCQYSRLDCATNGTIYGDWSDLSKVRNFEYRVEAAYHRRLGFYLVYVIRLDDSKTIVRTAYSKKEVVGIGTSNLRRLGCNHGVTSKDIVWRFIGELKQTTKNIVDAAPPLVELPDVQEHDESDTEEDLKGISEEQLEPGGIA